MSQKTKQAIVTTEIAFPNGNRARTLSPAYDTDPTDIVKALEIKIPEAVIMLSGGAGEFDKKYAPRLIQLFSRGVVQTAIETNVLIIDGGTQSGVMEIMGQGVADRGRQVHLLGVAPVGQIIHPDQPDKMPGQETPLDPNHSHFVLVDAQDWGGETDTMYSIPAAMANNIPVVTILVNGGGIAKQEILRSVRNGWPVIVLEHSGRLADEIAALWTEKPDFIPDPLLAEIIADGDIHLFPLESTVPSFQRLLQRLINDQTRGNTTLELVWERFAHYDLNADHQQKNFKTIQLWILTLGVLATLLVVIQATLRERGLLNFAWGLDPLHYLIVAIPITTSLVIAVANRFNAGSKWILLRGGAEAIKREIFRYRTRAEIYSKKETIRTSAEIKLTRKVEAISHNLMQTDVNLSALQTYNGPIPPYTVLTQGDDGLTFLTPDEYIAYRLEDQLKFYRSRAIRAEKRLRLLQWSIYIAGALGTLLAAINLDLWIAITTALAAALTTYLGYQQVENTLMIYNQSATDLANLQAWWLALSAEQQAIQKNIDNLVNHTEQIIKKEHAGWVQDMQDALAELRAEQTGNNENQDQTASPPAEET